MYAYLDTIKDRKLLEHIFDSAYKKDLHNVIDYGVNKNLIDVNFNNFNNALILGSIHILSLFIEHGFDCKIHESNLLTNAIIYKNKEAQKLLIDLHCTTINLRIENSPDLLWVQNYERIISLNRVLLLYLPKKKTDFFKIKI